MPVGRPRADRQLAPCREVGLTCHECVGQSARELSQIAQGLSPVQIRQMFNAMYPASNCLSMAGAFVQIVAQHQTPAPAQPRRPVSAAVPFRPAAVA